MKKRTFTLQEIYKEGREVLEESGNEESAIDAWLLLSYVTGISKAAYYGDPQKEVSAKEAERYFACIQKRCEKIPLQHITGEQEFMGYTFHVNEHVLIPRQDTECLVEEALKTLEEDMRVLDLCTGSGCILLSLLKMGREKRKKEGVTGIGADISGEALYMAKRNAEALQVEAGFIQSDLFERVEGTFDMIVSNPPYIPTAEIEGLQEEVRIHDPYIALDGKEDGLHFYRKIVKESLRYLNPGGYLMFEIGCEQGEAVSSLMREAGYQDLYIKKDLSGLDRVVCGRYDRK